MTSTILLRERVSEGERERERDLHFPVPVNWYMKYMKRNIQYSILITFCMHKMHYINNNMLTCTVLYSAQCTSLEHQVYLLFQNWKKKLFIRNICIEVSMVQLYQVRVIHRNELNWINKWFWNSSDFIRLYETSEIIVIGLRGIFTYFSDFRDFLRPYGPPEPNRHNYIQLLSNC